jgi:hypothetical protein
MKRHYICLDCVEQAASMPVCDMSVALFNDLRAELAFVGDKPDECPDCGGDRIRKVFGLETSYVRGYGYIDKAGTKRDMDLHAMSTGKDPYKEHRKMGESREVITKLQKDREHKTHSKTIHMG